MLLKSKLKLTFLILNASLPRFRRATLGVWRNQYGREVAGSTSFQVVQHCRLLERHSSPSRRLTESQVDAAGLAVTGAGAYPLGDTDQEQK